MGGQQSMPLDYQEKKKMEILEVKIFQIITYMKFRQNEIQGIYGDKKDFKPHDLSNMNIYMKVGDILGTAWSDPLLNNLMEECKNLWLKQIYPKFREKIYISKPDCIYFANFGRMLAGIAFIFGNYHLGLTYLLTSLEIQPDDTYVYGAVLKWACLLGEFGIFKMYKKKHRYHKSEFVSDLCTVGQYFCEFFDSTHHPAPKDNNNLMFESLMNTNKRLLSEEMATYQSLFTRQLIHQIFGIAALMPSANVKKYGDYNYHMKKAAECSLTCLTIKFENLFSSEILNIYHYACITESSLFLHDALAITDYFVTEKSFCQALLESGCVKDCETRILVTFFIGTKVVAPLRVLEPLNMLHYIKLRTQNDHDKLKGIRALTSLLLGRVFEDSAGTTISPFRTKLLEMNYSFPVHDSDQSFTVVSPISNTLPFDKHLQDCNCFLCYETIFNSNVFVQTRYSTFLLDNLSFSTTVFDDIGGMKLRSIELLQREQNRIYKILHVKEEVKSTVSSLSLLTDICVMLCNYLLINSSLPLDDKVHLCDTIIINGKIYPYHLRSYWLLARQMKREFRYYEKYPWLRYPTDDDMSIKEILKFGSDPPDCLTPKEPTVFSDAESDFEEYGHIFFIDWRRRICLDLGATFVEKDPWKSAFYFIESFGTSLREYIRVIKGPQKDLRFDNSLDFKHAVCQLFPDDFTYIQLVLDDRNVLWLIRCSSNYDPIILPVVQISNALADISNRFYNILVESDNTCKQSFAPNYWALRKPIEYKLEQLISDLQNVWFQRFKCLLIPFGNVDEKIARRAAIVENFLVENGINHNQAKFLSVLFFHAEENDFFYILHVFCLLQRDIFTSTMNEHLPENICQMLFTEYQNRDLFNQYLKKDKFVVLSVSQELSSYPWECLPIFVQNNALVTRIQAFHLFLNLLEKYQNKLPVLVNTENSYLLLDPSSNLHSTKDNMKKELKVRERSLSSLSQEQFLAHIANFDIFLFIGHGYGEHKDSCLRAAECRALPILMGCSSVRINDEGRGFDGVSVAHDYIIAGAPSVIGCLWMVSDGELDRYFVKFIELCASELSNRINKISFDIKCSTADPNVLIYPLRHMMKAAVEARKACILPLLTGAAVVSYGLPTMADPAPLDAYLRSRSDFKNFFNNNNVICNNDDDIE